MSKVRADLFASLDGYAAADPTPENPMGEDWGALTASYAATRTFRRTVLGDTGGAGTTGLDDAYAAAHFEGIGAEILGAGMFGFHAFPEDPRWTGWWGDEPPFHTPVYVLTHSAPRASLTMAGGTTFHFRSAPIGDVLTEAKAAAGSLDVRVGGGVSTAVAYVQAGLVDELHVMVAPVVLGRGRRLWDRLGGLHLSHAVTSEVADSGTVHVTFRRTGQSSQATPRLDSAERPGP